MTGVAPFDILVGPAKVWLSPTGTAFTATDDDPASPWVFLGKTDGQTQVQFAQTVNPIRVDQTTGPLKAVRVEEQVEITFSLAELNLENFGMVLNNATVATVTGPPLNKTLGLFQGVQVAQFAMQIRVDSPYNTGITQLQFPVVCQTDPPSVTFTRGDKSLLTSKWMTLEDPDATSDDLKFGQIVADSD